MNESSILYVFQRMSTRRFKYIALFMVQLAVLQLAFSLVFIQGFVNRDLTTIAIFVVNLLHVALVVALCISQYYQPKQNIFVKRLALCVYNMSAAVRFVMYASERVCSACGTLGAVRLGAALLENALSNVVYATIWRRVVLLPDGSDPDDPHYQLLDIERRKWFTFESNRRVTQTATVGDVETPIDVDDAKTEASERSMVSVDLHSNEIAKED